MRVQGLEPFPCNSCGKCCENVHLSELTSYLDRGDGCCCHFDTSTKLCSIYDSRPDICRVDVQYVLNYRHLLSWEEFVKANLKACDLLQ